MAAPTAGLAFLAVAGTLACLGLAVLAWGGSAAFFSHPALVALAVITLLLLGVSLFSGANLSPGEREDRGNRWVLLPLARHALIKNAWLGGARRRQDYRLAGVGQLWSASMALPARSDASHR